jgi:hypothetical protein
VTYKVTRISDHHWMVADDVCASILSAQKKIAHLDTLMGYIKEPGEVDIQPLMELDIGESYTVE